MRWGTRTTPTHHADDSNRLHQVALTWLARASGTFRSILISSQLRFVSEGVLKEVLPSTFRRRAGRSHDWQTALVPSTVDQYEKPCGNRAHPKDSMLTNV